MIRNLDTLKIRIVHQDGVKFRVQTRVNEDYPDIRKFKKSICKTGFFNSIMLRGATLFFGFNWVLGRLLYESYYDAMNDVAEGWASVDENGFHGPFAPTFDTLEETEDWIFKNFGEFGVKCIEQPKPSDWKHASTSNRKKKDAQE